MSVAELPRLLNSKQAAEVLGVAVYTLRKWRMLGQGPRAVKVEGAVRYDPADLQAYIERNRDSVND